MPLYVPDNPLYWADYHPYIPGESVVFYNNVLYRANVASTPALLAVAPAAGNPTDDWIFVSQAPPSTLLDAANPFYWATTHTYQPGFSVVTLNGNIYTANATATVLQLGTIAPAAGDPTDPWVLFSGGGSGGGFSVITTHTPGTAYNVPNATNVAVAMAFDLTLCDWLEFDFSRDTGFWHRTVRTPLGNFPYATNSGGMIHHFDSQYMSVRMESVAARALGNITLRGAGNDWSVYEIRGGTNP